MSVKRVLLLIVVGVMSIVPVRSSAATPKLGGPCSVADWGADDGQYVCVRIGATKYINARLPQDPPVAVLAATAPRVGATCKAAQWGRLFQRYVCAQTARAKFVVALLPDDALYLLLVDPPSEPESLIGAPNAAGTSSVEPATTPASATAAPTTAAPTTAAPTTLAPTTAAPTTAAPTTRTTQSPTTVPATNPPAATNPPIAGAKFSNCSELNSVYPHGVGRSGAIDQSSTGKSVTTFLVNDALYTLNSGLDRDKDGIACEKD